MQVKSIFNKTKTQPVQEYKSQPICHSAWNLLTFKAILDENK